MELHGEGSVPAAWPAQQACFILQTILDKVVKLVGGGSVINGAYPV